MRYLDEVLGSIMVIISNWMENVVHDHVPIDADDSG